MCFSKTFLKIVVTGQIAKKKTTKKQQHNLLPPPPQKKIMKPNKTKKQKHNVKTTESPYFPTFTRNIITTASKITPMSLYPSPPSEKTPTASQMLALCSEP